METGETLQDLTSPTKTGFSFGDIGFAISPDGLNLAFARFSLLKFPDLFFVPMSGGMPERLTESGTWIWGIAWTLDGQELSLFSGQA